MAEFAQSAASRAALHDAARQHLNQQILSSPSKALAAQLGVTQRTVNRWKAALTGSKSQARKPDLPKVAKAAKPLQVRLKADYAAGGDAGYLRKGKDMPAGAGGVEVDGAAFLSQALTDPDEAYQQFFESYIIPAGTVENVHISFS